MSECKDSLDSWIRRTEKQRSSNWERESYPVVIEPECFPALAPALAVVSLIGKRIQQLLDRLWIDIIFWKTIQSEVGMFDLKVINYLKLEYPLHLPPIFPVKVWKEFAADDARRAKLFEVIQSQPWRLVGVVIPTALKRNIDYLSMLPKNTVIPTRCPSQPDWPRSCKPPVISPNFGVILPPPERGRPHKQEYVNQVEEMVKLVREHPTEPNGVIVKMSLELPRNSPDKSVKDLSTLRKIVTLAKLLAEFRHDIRVKHHLDDRGHGLKPKRNG